MIHLVSYTLTHLKNYTIYYLETSTQKSFEDVVHISGFKFFRRANVGELLFFTSPVVSGIYIDF
jgi:hypothetical protein